MLYLRIKNNLYFKVTGNVEKNLTAEVYDINGAIISTQELNGTENIFHVQTQNLANGIYVLKISNSNSSVTKRFSVHD